MPDDVTGTDQWQARPILAWTIKSVALLLPFAVALGLTVLVSRGLAPAEDRFAQIRWWILLSLVAILVVTVVERGARRLLPLSALFGMTLTFPDRAPSRYRAAIRQGTVAQLERKIADVRENGIDDDPVLAADTLVELAAALSVHDRLTRGHSERVRAYTKLIAEELELPPEEVERIQWAGLAHDIGKLLISTDILNKPGGLTDEEYEEVKTHAALGAELVEPLRPWLGDAIDAVGQHHERWDGDGYPNGLAGTDISLAGRIVAVADVFDVITNARSYKKPSSVAAARRELVRCSGSHFDPRVVRAFLNVGIGRVRALAGPLSILAQVPVVGAIPLGTAAGGAAAAGSAAVFAVTGTLVGTIDDVPRIQAPRIAIEDAAGAAVGEDEAPDSPTTTIEAALARIDPIGVHRTGSTVAGGTPTNEPAPPAPGPGTETSPPAGPPPTTTTTTTTTTTSPPLMPRRQYLRMFGPAQDTFVMSSTAPGWASPEPDHDDDDEPGFTIKKGNQKLSEDDPDDYQHWILGPTNPLRLQGAVVLDLWSSAEDFDDEQDLDYSIWLHDCRTDGTDCRLLASVLDVHVNEWNNGVEGFVKRTISVGSVTTTIQPGRQLRLRFMVNHEDIWIASSSQRPSALVLPVI